MTGTPTPFCYIFFLLFSTSLTRFRSSFSNSLDAQLIEATSLWILRQQGRFAEAFTVRGVFEPFPESPSVPLSIISIVKNNSGYLPVIQF
jgi:hypothetical protein